MGDLPELDFSLPPEPSPGSTVGPAPGMVELLNENIARIEALKVRILENRQQGEQEKQGLFRELDILRGAFLEVSRRHGRPDVDGGGEWPMGDISSSTPLVLEGILGKSDKLNHLLKIISRIAGTPMTVLLEGETGSGKELFARIIHLNSGRRKFVAVNCGAVPSGLIESELFGHVKGAFTGATSDRKGKFEEADGGTIFLDEIGDLELLAQVKLLRVLEQGELQRVGTDHFQRVDVRVIAATNRNLEEMVTTGRFREDLIYRLMVCPLFIPPLRERRDEIEILLEFFFEEMTGGMSRPKPKLDPGLRAFLLHEYHYPGNIRELKNIAQYIAGIAGEEPLTLEDLPDRYLRIMRERLAARDEARFEEERAAADDQNGPEAIRSWTAARQEVEREFLIQALEKHQGSVNQVSAETGLSRARVYQLLKQFALKPRDFR